MHRKFSKEFLLGKEYADFLGNIYVAIDFYYYGYFLWQHTMDIYD